MDATEPAAALPPLISPETAAQLLGVSVPTVHSWQDRGLLAHVDQANGRMVPTADIDRYLAERAERAAWRDEIRRQAAAVPEAQPYD